MGRFRERERCAGEARPAAPQGAQRPLHRQAQIVGRIGHRPQPLDARGIRQLDPGEIVVIDPGLQRLGAPRGDGEHGLAQKPQVGQSAGLQRLDGHGHRARPVFGQHHGHAHPEIAPGAVQAFDDAKRERHGRVPFRFFLASFAGN